MKLSDNLIGASFMSASMAAFVINDTLMKVAGADMGVLQSIFARGIFATILMGIVAHFSGAFRTFPSPPDLRRIAFRTLAEVGATFCFVVALFNMPIANVTAVLQSLPLTIALAAAVFLRESISWRRTTAIVIGAIGVLIIIRPTSGAFNSYALLALAAVCFVTFRDLIVRRFTASVSSLFVAFVTATTITATSGVGLLLVGEWQPVDLETTMLLALAAVFVLLGYYFSIATMRFGEVAMVTPFRYTSVLWAIMLGWLVFGEIPDGWTFLGIGIILAAGFYTVWREGKARGNRID